MVAGDDRAASPRNGAVLCRDQYSLCALCIFRYGNMLYWSAVQYINTRHKHIPATARHSHGSPQPLNPRPGRSLLHSDSPTDRSICCLVEYVFSRAFRLSDLRRDCLTQDEMRMLSDRSDHICILRWLNASFSASI